MGISRGPQTAANADAVDMLIPVGDWVNIKDIRDATGLSDTQVRSAVAYIRDVIGLKDCLISGSEGYSYATDVGEVAAFRSRRLKVTYTMVDRTYKSIRPMLEGALAPSQADIVKRSFTRLLEDIQTLV